MSILRRILATAARSILLKKNKKAISENAQESPKRSSRMRVLVTGHKGYIGTILAPMLQKAGHDVLGLDSDLYRNSTFGEGLPQVPEILKDIRDIEKADLAGIDAIVHLAGLSNDTLGDLNPKLTYEINHAASVRLAAMAKEAGISRFVFASSCSNYGASADGMQDETARCRTRLRHSIQ